MTGHDNGSSDAGRGSIVDFIEEYHAAILVDWERAVRSLPQAGDLSRPVLINHMPELLAAIGQAAERICRGGFKALPEEAAQMHAIQRLEAGLDLDQVVSEFMVLRGCVLEQWGNARGARALDQAIDQVILASVRHYTQARNRTLQALDRVSAAALESRALDDFLERLIRLIRETMSTVDAMGVLLLESDVLRMRASAGMDGESMAGLALKVGEGFIGEVAAQRQPRLLSGDAPDADLSNDIRHRGNFQALYGFPLVDGEELIGVVVAASRSATDFSEQDRLLFAALASRTTAAIVQHVLRHAAERRAEQQAAVAGLGAFGLLVDEPEEVKERAIALIAEVLETDMVAVEQLDSAGYLRAYPQKGEWPLASPRLVEPGSQDEFTLAAQQPVVVNDYQVETRFTFPPALRDYGFRSGMTAPIEVLDEATGRPYGLIATYSRRQRSFDSQDALFLRTISSIIASAVMRRWSADALAVGAGRLRAILDHSPAAIYLKDLQGRYTLVNRRYEEIFGLASAAVVGRQDAELYPAGVAEALQRNDAQVRGLGQALEAEEHISIRGESRILLSIKFPLLDAQGRVYAICGISTDITDRRRSETALRESEERLQLATSVADLGTFDWDLAANKIGWSEKIREILGLSNSVEITQEAWRKLIHPDDRERVLELFNTAKLPGSGGDYFAEYRVRPADGSPERWINARGRILFDDQGQPRRFIGIARDVSANKQADLERERLLRELEQAVRFREDMLAIVSHDLRNPLVAIKMGVALLARKELGGGNDERVLKQLDIIQRASSRMEHLISSLLDMASIRAGRFSVERSACDAAALVDEALEFHAPAAAEKAVVLDRQLMLAETGICCDHNRIQQVFSNLLGNAINFCSSGDTIRIRAEQAGDCIRFTVLDDGPGIEPEQLAHIFEPYWSGARTSREGTGLGLFIAKGVIEAHGGRLWAESAPGEGSAFHFTIPLARVPQESGTS